MPVGYIGLLMSESAALARRRFLDEVSGKTELFVLPQANSDEVKRSYWLTYIRIGGFDLPLIPGRSESFLS